MTRTRRVYAGVLGLAISGLAVDFLLLRSEPQAASASENALAQDLAVQPPALATDDGQSLAQVIASLQPAAKASDALFAAPLAWLPSGEQSDAGPTLPALKLTNTLADVAQINGVAVRVGAYVDHERTVRLVRIESVGMRIDQVGQDPSAIIEFSGGLYRLRAGQSSPEPLMGDDLAGSAGRG